MRAFPESEAADRVLVPREALQSVIGLSIHALHGVCPHNVTEDLHRTLREQRPIALLLNSMDADRRVRRGLRGRGTHEHPLSAACL